MSLVNWEEHRARFMALREEKGITVKEYCEEHGLSFNTARKHLNMKKNEVQSQVKTTKKSTKSPEKKRAGRATKKLEEGAEKTKFTEIDNSQGAGSFRSMPRKKTSDHENNSNNNNEIKESVRRSLREKMAKMIPEEDKSAPKIEGSSAMIPDGAVQRATLPTTNVARDMMKNGAEEHLRLAIQMAQERALQYQSIVDQEAERLQAEIDALGDKE
ncbi:DNA pacase A subunit, partial [Salmonella enterica subsp. enterica]